MATTLKPLYGNSFNLTLTAASLASDTNLLAGRSSAAVDNISPLYSDVLLAGFWTAGTSPTASKTVEFWAWANIDDTPTYPDTITGSDANITLTSADIKGAALRLIASIPTDNTSNRKYTFAPTSLVSLFGAMPKKWGVFIVHNTGVAANATAGNHQVTGTPINLQAV